MEGPIGIIGAMEIEIDGLRQRMEQVTERRYGGLVYLRGRLAGREAVLCRCGPGKVNAAVCAQAMVDAFHPSCVINSGVAGGVGAGVGLLDIVVAENVCQHDVDTTAVGDPPGYVSGVGKVRFACDPAITRALSRAARCAGGAVHLGTVASGDQFIASRAKREQIAGRFEALAVEMEGGSIGQACLMNAVPFGVLRCISDSASGESEMEYPAFCRCAAEKTTGILLRCLQEEW